MEAFVALLGRYHAGVAVALIGIALVARGLTTMFQPFSPIGLRYFRGFRRAAIGLGLTAAGAAGIWQQPWLLAVGMGIALGETMECSFCISILTHEQRHPAAPTR